MACNGNTTDYFDFKCFSLLFEKFHSNLTDTGREYMREYPQYIKDELNLVATYKNLFETLTSYLTQDHLFQIQTQPVCCNYINYWLNDQIKNKHFTYPESIFKFFKEYTDGYAKKRFGDRSLEKKSCSRYYKYLLNEKFDKMKILYKMYEFYVQNITQNKYYENKVKCDNLKLIETIYNELRQKDPKDYELHSKLENFKNLIVNPSKPHTLQCDFDISKLMPLPIVTHSEVDDSHKKEQTLELPVPSSTVLPQGENLHESDTSTVLQEKEVPETRDVQEKADPAEVHAQEQVLESIEILDPQRERPHHQLGGQDYRLNLLHKQGLLDFTTRRLEQNRYVSNEQDSIPGGTEGIVDSIKGAFTGMVQNIDPVPVVGVSGGMGALFLLFRYTPVGTFFRGRGYRQRIPTRFDGVYQGFLPGFQGFEEGYFPNDQINIAYGRE
ncbi:Plasmodium vivax Vir protein, putative [Plasmodium vivax]|uniref:Vir protein, putative n=1 Tax=Plasmodium vivax TaxID=5855 RepID=A0A1G4E8D8_PLAVI|nr:Plasmodium vivax Vir protein, putative [Plasmodium vivax]